MMKKKAGKQKKTKSTSMLGQLPSTFSCSGFLDQPKDFSIFYKYQQSQTTNCGVMDFPTPKLSQIENLVIHSKKSGFGKGHENVVDESYRKALQVLPGFLGLNAQLEEMVTQTVCPLIGSVLNRQKVRAQLIKLNVYKQGSFFKQHVDSPKKDAFGSLVIFLPCLYEGGALVVKHKQSTMRYSFGSQKRISWVAFYNDCIHEIEEVKKGYRLTLSYNLYSEAAASWEGLHPSEDITAALLTLEDKKTYGFYCQHYYGNNALKEIVANPLSVLKGVDSSFWLSAKKLNKNVQLKVSFRDRSRDQQGQEHYTFYIGNPEKVQSIRSGYVYNEGYEDEIYFRDRFKKQYQGVPFNPEQVVWLNDATGGQKYVFAIDGYYGNDYSMNENYCELIMLLRT